MRKWATYADDQDSAFFKFRSSKAVYTSLTSKNIIFFLFDYYLDLLPTLLKGDVKGKQKQSLSDNSLL